MPAGPQARSALLAALLPSLLAWMAAPVFAADGGRDGRFDRSARRSAQADTVRSVEPDHDRDGIADHEDNCTRVKNALQCDSDFDGYGNACDGDYDQNESVDASDFANWLADLEIGEDRGIGSDSDCNGRLTARDGRLFFAQFSAGVPGPSGLACAGSVPCGRGDGSLPDPAFVPQVAEPAYRAGRGPVVLIDQTHENLGSLTRGAEPGLFAPFAALLTADGYTVKALESSFDRAELADAAILVVADPHSDFSEDELIVLRDLFTGGMGVLLLIERPELVPRLIAQLELDFTERRVVQIPPNCPDAPTRCPSAWNTFRREDRSLSVARREANGRKRFHEAVDSVLAFDSYGLIIDPVIFPRYRSVLTFGPTATYRTRSPSGPRTTSAAGVPFALMLDHERRDYRPDTTSNRLFVATNVEMFTALTRPIFPRSAALERIGLQVGGARENAQFVLNVVHDLDRGLDAQPPPQSASGYDESYVPAIRDPRYAPGAGPRIFFDHGHENHTVLVDGRCLERCSYEPFRRLAEGDGYEVAVTTENWADLVARLSTSDVVVSVAPDTDARVEGEADAILDWVRAGGSLFVIIDHFPHNGIRHLADRLGVEVSGLYNSARLGTPEEVQRWCHGFFRFRYREGGHEFCLASAPGMDIEFSLDGVHPYEGRVARGHPITRGRNAMEEIRRLRIESGNHFRITRPLRDASYVSHLTLPTLAQRASDSYKLSDYTYLATNFSGWSHAIAIELGAGRIYLHGNAGSLTALNSPLDTVPGFQDPISEDNEQLVLNVLHWLDGTL